MSKMPSVADLLVELVSDELTSCRWTQMAVDESGSASTVVERFLKKARIAQSNFSYESAERYYTAALDKAKENLSAVHHLFESCCLAMSKFTLKVKGDAERAMQWLVPEKMPVSEDMTQSESTENINEFIQLLQTRMEHSAHQPRQFGGEEFITSKSVAGMGDSISRLQSLAANLANEIERQNEMMDRSKTREKIGKKYQKKKTFSPLAFLLKPLFRSMGGTEKSFDEVHPPVPGHHPQRAPRDVPADAVQSRDKRVDLDRLSELLDDSASFAKQAKGLKKSRKPRIKWISGFGSRKSDAQSPRSSPPPLPGFQPSLLPSSKPPPGDIPPVQAPCRVPQQPSLDGFQLSVLPPPSPPPPPPPPHPQSLPSGVPQPPPPDRVQRPPQPPPSPIGVPPSPQPQPSKRSALLSQIRAGIALKKVAPDRKESGSSASTEGLDIFLSCRRSILADDLGSDESYDVIEEEWSDDLGNFAEEMKELITSPVRIQKPVKPSDILTVLESQCEDGYWDELTIDHLFEIDILTIINQVDTVHEAGENKHQLVITLLAVIYLQKVMSEMKEQIQRAAFVDVEGTSERIIESLRRSQEWLELQDRFAALVVTRLLSDWIHFCMEKNECSENATTTFITQ